MLIISFMNSSLQAVELSNRSVLLCDELDLFKKKMIGR